MTSETLRYLVTADYKQLDQLNQKTKELNGTIDKTEGPSAKQSAAFDNASRKAGFLALGVAGIGAASFKAAADFEKSMSVFGVAAQGGKQNMKAAREEAIRLGNDAKLPGVSAKDAADAMVALAKGGMSAKESMAAVRGTLMLANAAEVDNAEASTTIARTLKAYGLKAKDASKVTDVLAAAELKSTANMQEMAEGMKFAQGPAQTLGVDIDDTASTLALFNDQGLSGARAGTALSAMFKRLAAPTDKAAGKMKELGIDVFDNKGHFVGMQEATSQLTKGLAKLSPEEKLHAMQTMFAGQAMEGVNVLTRVGAKGYANYNKAINKTGSAQKLMEAKTSGAAGQMEQLKSSLETMAIMIGTELIPAITPLIQTLTKVLGILTKYPKVTTVVLGLIGGLAASLWAVNKAMKAAETIKDVAGYVKSFAKNAKVAALATKVWTAIQWLWNAAMDANPIGIIIIAIAALVVGLIIAYKKSETFRRIVDAALSYVADSAKKMWDAIKPVLDALVGGFNAVMGWLRDNWPLIVGLMLGPLGLIIAAIGTDAFGIRTKMVEGFQGILDWFTEHFSKIYDLAAEFAGKMKQGIVDALGGIGSAAWDVINNIWTVISGYVANVKAWGTNVGSWIKNAAVDALVGIGSAAWDIVNNIWTVISGYVANVKSWGSSVGTWIKNAVVDGITGVGSAVWNIVNNVGDWFAEKIKVVKEWGSAFGSWLLQGIINGIKGTASKVLKALKKYVTDKVPGFVKKVWDMKSPSGMSEQWGSWLMEGLAAGIDGAGRLAVKAADRQTQAIGSALSSPTVGAGIPALAGGGAAAPLVQIENVNVSEEDDARRLAKKLSASLAVRA